MKLAPGTHLGRYEILAEIGRGGMGVVYRARDPKIDRLVAIKTISLFGQEAEEVRDYRERFVFEARAAGGLSHPGIITIYDVGEEPETHDPYIVMEYVNGESLRKLLEEDHAKIPVKSTLQVVQELAEALYYAHTHGVIHRDIKPSNVLVTAGWHAKVADFGIAKLNLAQLTIPGQLMGSPAYMSPEQLNGEGVDGRSDLFSLGVILYNMVTGYRPFQGNSATTVCFKVVNRDPVPVTSFDAELPSELDEIITRAMAKEPADRFQTGAEMAEAISKFRDSYTLSEKRKLPLNPVNTPLHSLTGTLTATSFSRSLKQPAKTPTGVHARGRNAVEERIYIGGCIVLLWLASFILYRGISSSVRQPSQPVQAVQGPTAEHKSTVSALLAASDAPETSQAQLPLPEKTPKLKRTSAPTGGQSANMQIDVQHPFSQAELTIWIDNRAVYTQLLHGEETTHALVFHEIRGHGSDSLRVSAGPHRIHVRVRTPDGSYDQSKTISGMFALDSLRKLHVICDKRADDVSLTLQ